MPTTRRSTPLKAAIYEQLARIGHATASPGRLELLDLLSQGPRTVEALTRQTGRSMAITSHHLQVLRRTRLVDAERAGLYVTYRLAHLQVSAFLLHLRRLAESQLVEVQEVTTQYLKARGALEAVDDAELVRRVRGGEVTVIDVRPREEFLAGHIPGAVSMPLSDLDARVAELPRTREVVAYCRGPYCVMALDAVAWLRRKGFRAKRMEHGVPEWRARGWRIETGRGPRAVVRS
jgi:rhodanese-related sulfurtransferase